jgi:O-antigen/teichoic acid export membrane protein
MRRGLRDIAGALRGHSLILRNAAFMVLGSGSAAVLGFAYWWMAARLFPPEAVGLQSALISAMTFVGLLGELGFGTLLVGEALAQRDRAPAMIAAAILAGTGAALALALPVAALLLWSGWATLPIALLFTAGAALSACLIVADCAFLGLLQGRWQLYRNLAFSVAKLGMLAGGAALSRDQAAITLSWVLALGLSLGGVCCAACIRRVLVLARPDFRLLRGRMQVVIDHHLLNLSAAAPTLILPVVVSLCVSPAVSAAFYVGWMLLTVGLLVPASLTTVLFTLGKVEPESQRERLRFSISVSIGFGAGVSVLLALFAEPILRLFNPAYPALSASAVQFLGLGMLGATVKQHYVLFQRMAGRMMFGGLLLGLGAVLELGLAAIGGELGGVRWLTLGWLFALGAEAAVLSPPLLRAARFRLPIMPGGSRQRRPA